MGKPFTPERLASVRRMRKARRLYKKEPLFAYEMLCMEYPEYTYDNFWDDLRYRKKPKRRKGKCPLVRYGRYRRMEKLHNLYRETGNVAYALQAQRLQRRMTKPYRVLVRIGSEVWEYSFSPLVRMEEIESLTVLLPKCRTVKEAEEMVEQFRKTSHIN
jgi:hypothetical protein